ncbi:MAG: hypothetical protein ABF575_00130 [Liquorilactobacillus hordei]|uniref:hypothetical protein n=1 Tax=Liquorilactobacillus hordei TaxID=468911 RepID=UPI0039EB9082
MEKPKLIYYISLIDRSYSEVVDILLKKYGNVTDDYFKEKSYIRFLNGEIKSITHGKYKRTREGLFTHHIAEKYEENLGNTRFIKNFNYPFELQKKENLVYADLIEHLILHALIAKETNGDYGYTGYDVFIKPMVIEWYTTDMIPKPDWMKAVYKRSFLTAIEIEKVFRKIELGPLKEVKKEEEIYSRVSNIFQTKLHWKNTNTYSLFEDKEYNLLFENAVKDLIISKKELTDDEIAAHMRITFSQYLLSEVELRKIEVQNEKRKKEEVKKEEERLQKIIKVWEETYPLLVENGITKTTSRHKILRIIFLKKYITEFESFKKFNSARIEVIKDGLFTELETIFREEKTATQSNSSQK